MSNPIVSAIVLNYRTPQHTVRCVQALLAQTMAKDMEILIVDNHSQDDSMGVLRVYFGNEPRVRIVEHAQNSGYGAGNTFGASFAKGEYLLIINPDNALEQTGVERMVHALRADDSIGLVAPKLVYPDGSVRESSRKFPTMADVFIKRTALRHLFPGRMKRYLGSSAAEHAQDVDWVVGACFLTRKSLFQELHGFDPRFFLFFEDTDLCRRLWKENKRVVYLPAVVATDSKQRLSGGGVWPLFLTKAGRIHVVSALKYFWKWA